MLNQEYKSNEISRELQFLSDGQAAMDGDGVRMTRLIGTPELNMLDPFLLLDNFESDSAEDYIGGFPDHPHRGFETVTYLLAGRMRHKDSAGHEGLIEAGGVQWMTAGRGVVHSEMPEQEDGLLQGFQLWVNLPASKKMQAPAYQEFSEEEIPVEDTGNGGRVRVISGMTDAGTRGPIVNDDVNPLYLDVSLPAQQGFIQHIDPQHKALIFVIKGELQIGDEKRSLSERQLGVLGAGSMLEVQSLQESRFLLISARPLNEPVARGGPFVMNTKAEIVQAFDDYRNNRFLEN